MRMVGKDMVGNTALNIWEHFWMRSHQDKASMGRKFSQCHSNHTQATTENNWMWVLATIVPRTGLIESSLRQYVGLVPRRVINILFVRVSEEQVLPRGLISTYPLIVRTHWLRVTAWQSNVLSVRCHPFIFFITFIMAQKTTIFLALTPSSSFPSSRCTFLNRKWTIRPNNMATGESVHEWVQAHKVRVFEMW